MWHSTRPAQVSAPARSRSGPWTSSFGPIAAMRPPSTAMSTSGSAGRASASRALRKTRSMTEARSEIDAVRVFEPVAVDAARRIHVFGILDHRNDGSLAQRQGEFGVIVVVAEADRGRVRHRHAVIGPPDAGPEHGGRAHAARGPDRVEIAARKIGRAERGGGPADRQHLGMGG